MYDTAASPSGTSEFLLRRLDSHFTQKTINFIYLLKAERCNVNVRAGRDRLRAQDTRLGRSAPPLCYNIGTGRQIFHDWNLCTFSRPCTCAVHQTIGMSSGYIFNKYFFFFLNVYLKLFLRACMLSVGTISQVTVNSVDLCVCLTRSFFFLLKSQSVLQVSVIFVVCGINTLKSLLLMEDSSRV